MMSFAEYADTIHKWTLEVERTALEMFESGVHPQECTGLAINIVESRRKKKAAEQSALSVPPGMTIRGN